MGRLNNPPAANADPWSSAVCVAKSIQADSLAVALVRSHPLHCMSAEQWEVMALLYAGERHGGGMIRIDGDTRRISPYGRIVRPVTEAALLRARWIENQGLGYVLTSAARAFVAGRTLCIEYQGVSAPCPGAGEQFCW